MEPNEWIIDGYVFMIDKIISSPFSVFEQEGNKKSLGKQVDRQVIK